jgi:hypothetical protein
VQIVSLSERWREIETDTGTIDECLEMDSTAFIAELKETIIYNSHPLTTAVTVPMITLDMRLIKVKPLRHGWRLIIILVI